MECTNCGKDARRIEFRNGWVMICGRCDEVVFSEDKKLKEEKHENRPAHSEKVFPTSLSPR